MASLVATPALGEREGVLAVAAGNNGRQKRMNSVFLALYSNVYFVDIPRCHFLSNASFRSVNSSFFPFIIFVAFFPARSCRDVVVSRYDPVEKQFQ